MEANLVSMGGQEQGTGHTVPAHRVWRKTAPFQKELRAVASASSHWNCTGGQCSISGQLIVFWQRNSAVWVPAVIQNPLCINKHRVFFQPIFEVSEIYTYLTLKIWKLKWLNPLQSPLPRYVLLVLASWVAFNSDRLSSRQGQSPLNFMFEFSVAFKWIRI